MQGKLRSDVFSKIEGEEFLSNQLGLSNMNLSLQARKAAALVGYHKCALIIIRNMISPMISQEEGMKWNEVLEYLSLIKNEISHHR